MIDVAANGALMSKTHNEAYELLEEITSNNQQWLLERYMPKKVAGVHEIDATTALSAQVATLSKQQSSLNVNAIQTPSQECELCGRNHARVDCQVGRPFASSSSEQDNLGPVCFVAKRRKS